MTVLTEVLDEVSGRERGEVRVYDILGHVWCVELLILSRKSDGVRGGGGGWRRWWWR